MKLLYDNVLKCTYETVAGHCAIKWRYDVMINPPAEDITAAETAPRPKKETKLKTKRHENLDNILIMLSKYT